MRLRGLRPHRKVWVQSKFGALGSVVLLGIAAACSSGVGDLTFEALSKRQAGSGGTGGDQVAAGGSTDPGTGATGGSESNAGGEPSSAGGSDPASGAGGVVNVEDSGGSAGTGGAESQGGAESSGGASSTGGISGEGGTTPEGGAAADPVEGGGSSGTPSGGGGPGGTCPTGGLVEACADSTTPADPGTGCPRFLSTCQRWTVVEGYTPSTLTLGADFAGLAQMDASLSFSGVPSWGLVTRPMSPASIRLNALTSVTTTGGQTLTTSLELWSGSCPHVSTRVDIVVLSPASCQ